MLRFTCYALCSLFMLGFFYFCRFLIYDISFEFGMGVATGVGIFVILFWLGERLGAFQMVEPSKGTWVPHDSRPTARRDYIEH